MNQTIYILEKGYCRSEELIGKGSISNSKFHEYAVRVIRELNSFNSSTYQDLRKLSSEDYNLFYERLELILEDFYKEFEDRGFFELSSIFINTVTNKVEILDVVAKLNKGEVAIIEGEETDICLGVDKKQVFRELTEFQVNLDEDW